jgi:hypothetical protein
MRTDDLRPRPPEAPPAPRKRRFRLEKLEQRIAPKKGGKGTNNCAGDSAGDTTWWTGSGIY